MSVKATYTDGVFKPLEKVQGATVGKVYTVFSEEELDDLFLRLGFDEDDFSEKSWAETLNKKILELTG